jgi:membrane fusion protein, multidrug efflux system
MSRVLVRSPAHKQHAGSDAPPEPPLRPKRSLGRWLLLAILVAAVTGSYFAVPWDIVTSVLPIGVSKPDAAPAARPVPVVAVTARQGDMDLYLNGLGTVTALYTVTLRSRVDGELITVNFTEGQVVKKGDLLAQIDPRPYQVQRQQAEGQLLKDKAGLKINELNLDRYTILAPAKTITKQQLDEQAALVKQSEGVLETDEATIKNIDLQLKYCEITAPIPGTIGLRLVDPGNMVKANDPMGMAVINQLQPITIVFTIPQDDIGKVQRQINAGKKLTVDAYDRDRKTKLASGSLMALDNQVDTTTGTVRLKAVFPNDDNMLFPNQFVNARLLVDTKRDAVIVPAPAVQQGPNGTFVYVVGSDSTVEVRSVAVGPTEGDETAIESGLSPGDVVVVDGVDKLQKGTKVALRERSSDGGGSTRPAVSPAAQGS